MFGFGHTINRKQSLITGFDPSKTPGVLADWSLENSESIVNDSGFVSEIADSSANNNHAIQSEQGEQGKQVVLNGRKWLDMYFDSDTSKSYIFSPISLPSGTIFCTARVDPTWVSSSNGMIMSYSSYGGNSFGLWNRQAFLRGNRNHSQTTLFSDQGYFGNTVIWKGISFAITFKGEGVGRYKKAFSFKGTETLSTGDDFTISSFQNLGWGAYGGTFKGAIALMKISSDILPDSYIQKHLTYQREFWGTY